MKKFLLTLLTFFVAAFYASADSVELTASAFTSGTTWVPNENFTFVFSQSTGSTAPAYNSNNKDLRLYANGTVSVTAAENITIQQITFNLSSQGKKRLAPITASVGVIASQASGDTKVVWSGDTNSVTFTVGSKANYGSDGSSKAGQLCFSSVSVVYTIASSGGDTELAEPEIAWSAESYTATLGEAFEAPTLTNPNDLTVTYESSNTSVATIDSDGTVAIVGAGQTTISAKFDGDETYKESTVSYELNVITLGAIKANGSEATDLTVYANSEVVFSAENAESISYTVNGGDAVDASSWTPTEVGNYTVVVTATLASTSKTQTFNVTVEEAPATQTVTFVFAELYTVDTVVEETSIDPVTILGDKGSHSNSVPKYFTNGTNFRAYTGNTVTFSVPDTYLITKIESTFSSSSYNGGTMTADSGSFSSDNTVWTADGVGTSNVVFTIGDKQARWTKIVVTYAREGSETPDTREDVTLTFSETECSAVYGDAFMEPTLAVNPDTAAEEVKYSSSNTEVATVDGEGKVSILAAGETTITAAIKDSETYKDAEASYTLTVIELGAIMFNDFVLDEGHMCTAFVGKAVTVSAANAEVMSYTIDGGDPVEVEGSSFTWTPDAVGNYAFSVSASLGGQDKTVNFTVTVEEQTIEATLISDVLTLSCFDVSGSTYKEVTYVSEECGLTYTAQMAGGNSSIQLRSSNSNSGIVVSANKYGLVAQAATIKWNSNTSSNRALSFYGQQTAFTAPTELYNTEAESLGEKNIDDGAEQTIVFTEDFRYIGLRSKNNAQYVDSIAIIWTLPEPTVYIGEQNAPTIISQLPATLEFATTADEFVKVYYKFEEDGIAAAAAADGYTEVPAEGLTINSFGVLSYYAEVNGWTSNLSTIKFADTTGIVEIEGSEAGEAQWYDLNGRRVAAPGKGIYILKQGNKATKYAF